MAIKDLQKQTNINIQEKANLIWNIATHIVGLYKPHEYGNVILPFTILKRFDDALKDTKKAVLEMKRKFGSNATPELVDGALKEAAKHDFYNTSRFDFGLLAAEDTNIEENFKDYLDGYSENVRDILANFNFENEVKKLADNGKLYIVVSEFNSAKADFSPSKITSADMGYIFEELIRKFSESYDEQAGAHFTARDIIYLMTELLVAPERDEIKKNGCFKLAYDMAMGTSQMLGCLDEKLKEINPNSDLTCFGQEFNPQTYAIAKADMLIKGGNADGMKFGDTLDNDQFTGHTFDYIISNPPFGIDWKSEEKAVKEEYTKFGFEGRFGPGLPAVGDGQLLFMLNGVKKLKDNGRMAIIQNGSSLFNGDAGSGPSNIRKYLFEEDLIEAIIQLPNDLFYNTGIATYIWVITREKESRRLGKVQLIDASNCYEKRRKNIGSKRVDLSDECLNLIMKAYNEFEIDKEYLEGNKIVKSKVFDNNYFGYVKIAVETAQTDNNGRIILKKNKPIAVKGKTDSETVPLTENVEDYFKKNVLPFNPAAFYYKDENNKIFDNKGKIIDEKHNKVGYEIPFIKIFYRFVEPKKSEEIFEDFELLSKKESALTKKILGKPLSHAEEKLLEELLGK